MLAIKSNASLERSKRKHEVESFTKEEKRTGT
jgi:hypothetical protein